MSSVLPPPTGAPPDNSVRRAVADSEARSALTVHAAARVFVSAADRRPLVPADFIEDAVQETLRRALARESDYSFDRGSVLGWLHGILNNVLSEYFRSARKQPIQLSDPAVWDMLAERLDPVAATEARRELNELLAGLEPDHREIITLHHLDEMSHADIAARLGISPAASRTRLARAMLAIRGLATRKEGSR